MFGAKKPNFLVLIKAHEVVLLRKGRLPASVTLPLEAVQYLEVRDTGKLNAVISDFLKPHPIQGQQVLFLLDKSVVFQKLVQLDEKTTAQQARSEFLSKMPFDPRNVQVMSVQQGNKLFLFGVNRPLYLAVKQAFEQVGVTVISVTPASILGISEGANVDTSKFNQIRDSVKSAKGSDFLTAT